MRFSILCQFERQTACGIHMEGKSRALVALGHQVILLHHPFKFEKLKGGVQEKISPQFKMVDIYSNIFENKISLIKKIFRMPGFAFDLLKGIGHLKKSDYVFIHKPLPLGLLYVFALKFLRYSGKIITIIDDWEGVGGMATVRQADSTINKLLATWADEYLPVIADGNICSSKLSVQKLKLSSYTQKNWIWIPLGASETSANKNPDGSGKFQVGYVGSFKSKSLIDFLLSLINHAIKLESKIQFCIIGGGDEFGYLNKKVDELGLSKNVSLTGQISHAQVEKYLASFSLCLLYLNHEFPENYIDASRSSTKMFEYMAMGKIVIASNFGEPRNILRNNRTGFLVENKPEKFARKIHYLYQNQTIIKEMRPLILEDFKSKYSHNRLMGQVIEWLPTL